MTHDSGRSITDRYELRTERFGHGPFSAHILLPLSSEDLIDERDFDEDERLPYWAELWPSARALARHLLDQPNLPERALEVGCGVGLPSLTLSWRGVHMTATDYYDDALSFVALNAERNHITQPRTRTLDWRQAEELGDSFPLVIAADVLYEERNAIALAQALPILVQPGGDMILADPGRAYRDHFLTLMAERGWSWEKIGERCEPLIVEDNTDPAGDSAAGPNPERSINVSLFLLRPPDISVSVP